MSRITSLSEWLLRQAVVWGGFAFLLFYALVVRTVDSQSVIGRYFGGDGWVVKYTTAGLFFVGVAALVIRLLGLLVQFGALERTGLSNPPAGGNAVEDADALLEEIEGGPAGLQDGYFLRRLRQAVLFVKQKGSADTLDEQLQRLEDVDLDRMNQSYSTVRVIASTIPILGFLGTVIGITMAIAKLSGQDMEQNLPAVIAGLSVAFDTTAQALALSIILLFTKFGVEKVDARLLTLVDERVNRQLLGRFRQYGSANDPHVASIKRMNEQMLAAVKDAAAEQTTQISGSLVAATTAWHEMAESTASVLRNALVDGLQSGLSAHAAALNDGVAQHTRDMKDMLVRHAEILSENVDSHAQTFVEGNQEQLAALVDSIAAHGAALADALEHHVAVMTETETQLASENRRHLGDVESALGETMIVAASRQEKLIRQSEELLKEMQVALVEAAGATVAQQEQLIKQSDVLLRVVESTGAVRKLEEALNSNLAKLVSVHDFEQLFSSLSATLQLLSSRVGLPLALSAARHDVDDDQSTTKSQAA
ncbi:MAG: MotA/TolQ/ExbB proton channel family protein [Planctomycetales bacterium]|nr:MotA/TolQ/ExbB proton channel family protein [Planctomycetales bacterium]